MRARPLPPADTRLPPELTRLFGVDELHALTYQPTDDRGGPRDAVSISVPEASRRVQKRALAVARARRARVSIICDTSKRAEEMRRFAEARLPDHRFIALERVEAGAWGPLA